MRLRVGSMSAYTAFEHGAIAAEKVAHEWAMEAQKSPDNEWKKHCLEQQDKARERMIWYRKMAGEAR